MFRATARPIHAKTELKHTERGTQHCNNGRPTPVCDPYRPNRKDSLVSTHSSSMKGPRLNFHAERQLAGRPKTTCFCKVEFQPFQTVALTADVFQLLDKLQSSTPNRNPPELLVKHTSHIHNLFRYRRQHNARVFFSYSCTLLF